jgi:hypothetical protein
MYKLLTYLFKFQIYASFLFLFFIIFSCNVSADSLDLKAPKQDIINYDVFNGDVKYFYSTNEVKQKAETINGKYSPELIEKRTKNSETYAISPTISKTYFYSGDTYYFDGSKWLQLESATTTLKNFNTKAGISILDLIFPNVLADSYFSGSGDGQIYLTDSSFALVRDGTTGTSASPSATAGVAGVYKPAGNWYIYRVFFPFDTSDLPDSATILTASLTYWTNNIAYQDNDAEAYLGLVQTSQASNITLSTDDYDAVGFSEGATSIALDDLAVNNYNTMSLSGTGLGWINKTGFTNLGLLEGHDINNVALSGNYDNEVEVEMSEYASTDHDPYLTITWEEGSPPVEETPTATSTATLPGQPLGFIIPIIFLGLIIFSGDLIINLLRK